MPATTNHLTRLPKKATRVAYPVIYNGSIHSNGTVPESSLQHHSINSVEFVYSCITGKSKSTTTTTINAQQTLMAHTWCLLSNLSITGLIDIDFDITRWATELY